MLCSGKSNELGTDHNLADCACAGEEGGAAEGAGMRSAPSGDPPQLASRPDPYRRLKELVRSSAPPLKHVVGVRKAASLCRP